MQQNALTLVLLGDQPLPAELLADIAQATDAKAEQKAEAAWSFARASKTEAFFALLPRLDAARLDFGFLPTGKTLADFKLAAFDMDSTLITIECIDELADFAGQKKAVAEVTEAAMRGQMDYRESLRQRLALLAGLPAGVLARVYAERLKFSPGARELIGAMQAAGLRTALVSGGFTYFTERLRIELGLDFATSNELEIENGKLTGRVIGEVIDAQAKAGKIVALQKKFSIRQCETITVGDGANDLLMMGESGLSVAWRAKQAVRGRADVSLGYGGLDSLLKLWSFNRP
ncbi:MAG: phosphoserine phosphatase SerB [Zoogloeaceae bacterium]|nr:phosphoserine phosphatase SerB [Zoogloeaceae bacterium]